MRKYIFDTNIFNDILDWEVDISILAGKAECFSTHIQYDEILNTTDPDRKAKLVETFKDVSQAEVPTESFVLDVSRLDEAKLGDGKMLTTESSVWGVSRWGMGKWTGKDSLYHTIKANLDKKKKRKITNKMP